MSVGANDLGKTVTARFANGSVAFSGQMVSLCDVPSVGINCGGGTPRHWRADMCEVDSSLPAADGYTPPLPEGGSHDPATCWWCQHGDAIAKGSE